MTEQIDLFLDTLTDAPVKDDRATMEFPFFCLAKKAQTKPMIYDDGNVHIEIKAGSAGIATIWDKDILIYCASIINDRLERGLPVERKVVAPAYDILRVCHRGTGKRSYDLLLDALERLRATTVLTNITSDNERERRGFGWIDNFRVHERRNKNNELVACGVEIWLNEWMFRAIIKERRVLSIDRAYFRLTMGLERRLYELARKHCGYQPSWEIRMTRLYEKSGSEGPIRNFKIDLRRIMERNSLPGYVMTFVATDANIDAAKTRGYDKLLVRFQPKTEQTALAV